MENVENKVERPNAEDLPDRVKKSKVKRPFNPIWFLIIGIAILIVPAAIYLGILCPRLSDEYNILMASGGVVGGGGLFGAEMIPDKVKFGTLYKTAAKSFTFLTVITIVQNFLPQIIGLIITVIVCYIVFLIFKELWKNGKQKRESLRLAEEVSRRTAETLK